MVPFTCILFIEAESREWLPGVGCRGEIKRGLMGIELEFLKIRDLELGCINSVKVLKCESSVHLG